MSARRLLSNPLTLLSLLHFYVGWRLLPALIGHPVIQGAFTLYLCLSFGLIPLSVRVQSLRNQRLGEWLTWAGFLAMGLFSSLFVLTVLRELLPLIASFFLNANLAAWMDWTAHAVIVCAIVLSVAGLLIARRGARVREVGIPITNLPDSLHGFCIVQISDIHVGATIKRDFHLSAHTEPLSNLIARHGAFFVTGNHEYYSGERASIRPIAAK